MRSREGENLGGSESCATLQEAERGAAADWPVAWAGDSLREARRAFSGLYFGPRQAGLWSTSLPADYSQRMTRVKRLQLTRAGARLAQTLQALFP